MRAQTERQVGGVTGEKKIGHRSEKLVFSDTCRGVGANGLQPPTALERRRDGGTRAPRTAAAEEERRARR